MKKHFLAILILSLLSAHAQRQYIFKGNITKVNSAEGIAFAHINIENRPGKGFISRIDGSFYYDAYNTKDTVLQVRISALGYVSKSVTLYAGQNNPIVLDPSAEVLNAVIVTPLEWERQLVQRVIEKIPENYSASNERLVGAVTEETFADSALSLPFYTANALIEADKPNYKTRSPVGNVRVISGETEYFPAADTAWLGIQAGPYNIFRFDLVANRRGPLQKSQLKKFDFSVVDTLLQDGDLVLKMADSSSNYSGMLFINLTDTALLKAEVIDIDFEAGGGFSLNTWRRKFLHYTVSYAKFDGAYRLRYIHYQTAFKSGKDQLFLENTFSIISVADAATVSPSGIEINYTELLTDYTKELERLNDSTTVTQEVPSFTKFFRKLVIGYTVFALPQTRSAFTGRLGSDLDISKAWNAKDQLRVAAGVSIEYPIYKRFWLSVQTGSVGNKEATLLSALGISYKQPLSFSGRYKLVFGADYLALANTSRFYNLQHEGTLTLNNKPFDSGRIDFLYQQRSNGIAPRLSFDFQMNNALTLRLQGTYHLSLGTNQSILAREENERWFWNRVSTTFREGEDFQSSHQQPFANNWWIGLGIVWK